MVAIHLDNLRLFVPQYLISTLAVLMVYFYLGRRFPGRRFITPVMKSNEVKWGEFSTPLFFRPARISANSLKFPATQTGQFTTGTKGILRSDMLFFDPLYYMAINGYGSDPFVRAASTFCKSSMFESPFVYQVYRIFLCVGLWAGLMLLITPFREVFVFIPHFQAPYSIIIAIALAISIFEGVVAGVYFFFGASAGKIAIVTSAVVIAFTASLLSPSMSWLQIYTIRSELFIYLILLFLFSAITILMSQLKSRRNLFLASFIFSFISYFLLMGVILINVLQLTVA